MSEPMSKTEFDEITSSWGMSDSIDAVFPLIEPLQAMIGSVTDLPRTDPTPIEADRRLGDAPTPEDDPYNAIVRWCDVSVPGADGLLSGMRVAVKDCMAVAGLPMTVGSALFQGFVSDRDAAVVELLLQAGGRIVAMTNMDDMGVSPGGDGSFYGPTLNPLDTTRTAGGSSGGAGAALYYDGIDVTLGADSGGSVRIPAAWCGVIGHKPTHGLVSHSGVPGGDFLIDHVGPLSRTAAEGAKMMQAISGRAGDDPRQPADLPDVDFMSALESAATSLQGVKIGVITEGLDPSIGMTPEVEQEFEASVKKLEALGATVSRVSVPEHLRYGPIGFNIFARGFTTAVRQGGNGVSWEGDYWPQLAEALRDGLARIDETSPQFRLTLILGSSPELSKVGDYYSLAANARKWLRAGYDRHLESCDFLVTPTVPWVAHQVIPDLDVPTRVMRSWSMVSNTFPLNLTGHPALSLPLGSSDGLPVGLQLIGKHFDDAAMYALAQTVERQVGWA